MTERHARQPSAVVVGLHENGLAVVRALGRAGVHVIALHDDPESPGVHSRFCRPVCVADLQARLIDALVETARSEPSAPALFLTTDHAVQVVGEGRQRLSGLYLLNLPEQALLRDLMDKRAFADRAAALGCALPATATVSTKDDVERVAGTLRYPVVMKPQEKSSLYMANAKKAYQLESIGDLVGTYDSVCRWEQRFVIQEWIPGGDGDIFFCLQYYSGDSTPLVSFTGRKIRQWRPHTGGTCAAEPVDLPELERETTRFFTAVGYRGLGSMEYKRDPRDGRFLMIEPTVGRTDFQEGVAIANGVNIPFVGYCDLAGREIPDQRRGDRSVKWVHWASDRLSAAYYREAGELDTWAWLTSLRGPRAYPYLAFDDPGPLLAIVRRKLRSRVRRLFARGDARR